MNQDILDGVKQEMARVNNGTLGIIELKWMGKGEFNSDDHYIYHCGQEFCRRNRVALIVNKRVHNAVFVCNLKKTQSPQFISKSNCSTSSNPSLCPKY